MTTKAEIIQEVDNFFSGTYAITEGRTIPNVSDISFGKNGREIELAMLFIDIRESTKIVNSFRRITAARMYKSFLWGVSKIARMNEGELRSFNGDGVLMAFAGDSKCTHAAKAALQMSWFCRYVLKPKVESYFKNNNELKDLDFDFGIGIDVGKVLVVRGGIKGENNNDLVWVGNATNYAVKVSSIPDENYFVYITEEVYNKLHESSRIGGDPKREMWERRVWKEKIIYRSSWWWSVN